MKTNISGNSPKMKFKDLCEKICFGGIRPLKENGLNKSTPLVEIADIMRSRKYIYNTKNTIEQKTGFSRMVKFIPEGAIICPSMGGLGKIAIASRSFGGGAGIMVIILKEDIDPEYIYYFLNYAKSAVDPRRVSMLTKVNFIKYLSINLPPAAEQKKIVSILSSAEDAVWKCADIIKKTRRIKDGLLKKNETAKGGDKEKIKEALLLAEKTIELQKKRYEKLKRIKRGTVVANCCKVCHNALALKNNEKKRV